MNLDAKCGDKARYLDENGYTSDTEGARKAGLVKGEVYTVESVEVCPFMSWVTLQEFPGRDFNTVMFKDADVDIPSPQFPTPGTERFLTALREMVNTLPADELQRLLIEAGLEPEVFAPPAQGQDQEGRCDALIADLVAGTPQSTQDRPPKTHYVKCWPGFFASLSDGRKPFELRLNDRDYRVGDTLVPQEWDPQTSQYTGRELRFGMPYVLYGPVFGLADGHCIMSVVPEVEQGSVASLPGEWREKGDDYVAKGYLPQLAEQLDWCAAELERRLQAERTVPAEAVRAVVREMRAQTEERELQGHDIWVWRVRGWAKRLAALLRGERCDKADD